MKNTKKAQAALEYLTTYGWAILVIAVAMSALVYFGILNPAKFAPNSCTTDSSFRCADYILSASEESVRVKVANSMAKPVIYQGLTCIFADNSEIEAISYDIRRNEEWLPNKEYEFICEGSSVLKAGEKGKVKFEIQFQKSKDGYTHTSTGIITANVNE
ncbi:MAG: hypothetical protein V1659_01525 [Candidatus Woesearchaeota archaeon]